MDGGLTAAWISFLVGLLVVGVIGIFVGRVRRALASIPKVIRAGRLTWWQLLGGIGGAWLVTSQGLVVPVVGVTLFVVSVVAGQVVGSLFVDRLGLSPAGVFTVTGRRGLAARRSGGVAKVGRSRESPRT